MDFIAVNLQGLIRFDFRDAARLTFFTSNGVTAEDIENDVVSEWAAGQDVANYVTSEGYAENKYWNGTAWTVRPTSVWAVFANATDLTNSFTPLAQSLDGLRYVLTPKTDAYVYTGVGKHTGASGADIAAQEITAQEVDILLDSPKFNTNTSVGGLFATSDIVFCSDVVQFIKIELLKANGTFAEQQAALTLLKPALEALISSAPLTASIVLATIVPAGLFTSQMKTDATNMLTAYLNKFPR
jgi:hypothetical protein